MQTQLDKLAAKGAIIWERFNAHQARRETDFKVISGALSRRRACKRSGVVRLKAHLRDVILVEERNREIPSEAPLPAFKAKTLEAAGYSDDRLSGARCPGDVQSPEQLRSAIERECQRRVAAGFVDAVQVKQRNSQRARQPSERRGAPRDMPRKKVG
eukprot:6129681-Prymnesium_polylepis.1